MQIITPFTEGIYYTNLSDLKKYNSYFCEKVEKLYNSETSSQTNWRCDTYNHNISEDDIPFKNCMNTFSEHVSKFITHYLPKNNFFKCGSSWINLSKSYCFQEYHIHSMSHFSAVYYVKVPENSGDIIFKKHGSNNMFGFDVSNFNQLNQVTYAINPKECDFLIFKSNLEHMVQKNMSDESRVSLSMNFTLYD